MYVLANEFLMIKPLGITLICLHLDNKKISDLTLAIFFDVYNKKISELLKNKLAKLKRLNPFTNKNASPSNKVVMAN